MHMPLQRLFLLNEFYLYIFNKNVQMIPNRIKAQFYFDEKIDFMVL